MKEIESEAQAAKGRPAATNGMAAHADAAPLAETSDAPAVATVSTVRSRFGPAGSFAKRVMERLVRLYAGRQEAANARLTERLQRLEAEVAGVRPDLVAVALDFGAIADRMRAFENVRRVVERSAPFRYEVRNHRRELAELHQHVAALSARLTLIQRESAPVRAAVDGVRDEFDALRDACDRLAERALKAEASIEGASERLTGLARDAEDRKEAVADAEDRIAHLQADIEQVRSATARDLAQRSTELRAVVEEVERRLSATAEHLTRLVEKRGRASDLAFETLRSALTANHDELRTGLEERIERAQRTAATLRTTFDVFQREATEDRARATAADEADEELIGAVQLRLADVAGALNQIRDSAIAEQAAATARTPEFGAVEQRLERLDAEVAGVRHDLVSAALDFGAVAERMRAYENVRRVVERSAPFRDEVRNHRRELAELRQHVAALSARLTLIQRESAPVRAAVDGVRDEINALREASEDRVRAAATEAERLSAAEYHARLEADEELIGAIQLRLADIAGALNQIRDSAPEFGTIEQRLDGLAAEFEALRGRLEATPKRIGAIQRPPLRHRRRAQRDA